MRRLLLLVMLTWLAMGGLYLAGSWKYSPEAVAATPLSLEGYLDEKLPEATETEADKKAKAQNFACYVCHGSYYSGQVVLDRWLLCVFDGVVLKEPLDTIRLALRTPQAGADVAEHLLLGTWTPATLGGGFDVMVQKLIRIQLGAVTGQCEETNLVRPFRRPLSYFRRPMDGMAVENQEDRTRAVPQQSTKKADEHLAVESLLEHHESQTPSVSERRDEIASESLASSRNDRRLAAFAVTGAGLMVTPQAHLVAPVDFRPHCSGFSANRRILLLKPTLNGPRNLLVGPSQRFLRREAPLLQITSDRPHRDAQTEPLGQQLADRFSGPQGKGKSKLIGAAVADQPHRRGRLPSCQSAAAWPTTWLRSQRPFAAPQVGADPRMHGGPRDAKRPCCFGFREILFHHRMHHPLPQILLGCWRKASCVKLGVHAIYTHVQYFVFRISCPE